jgi:AraC-like DNA-binding protein
MENSSSSRSFDPMPYLAAFGRNLKPLRMLFGKYVFERSLTHFPSERGTGKSFLLLELCLCVAHKAERFCNEKIELHGNTLFINCELSKDLISRRLAKLFENLPFHNSSNEYEAYVYTTRQSFAQDRAEIIEKIELLKPVLVVLDNWKTAYQDIDSNKSKDATAAMIDLLNLKDKYGFALVVTDHTRKGTKLQLSDSDLQSGSGTKSDLADQDFLLRKSSQNPSFRILKRVKSRICEDATSAKLLRFNPDTLWFEVEQEEVNEIDHLNGELLAGLDEEAFELARAMVDKGASFRDIARVTGISKSTLHRKFKK